MGAVLEAPEQAGFLLRARCLLRSSGFATAPSMQVQPWLGSFTSPLNTQRLERRQSLHFKCLPCSINAVRRDLCDGTMAEEALVLHRC